MGDDELWQDDLLTPEEYARNGLSTAEGEALWAWVYERVGLVVTDVGFVGSGVFVRTPNGRLAFLTASHVLVPALLRGSLAVTAFVGRKGFSSNPEMIRVSTKCDAALLLMGDDCRAPCQLAYDEWKAEEHQQVQSNTRAISAGLPGAWMTRPNVHDHVIDRAKILLFWASVIDVDDAKHEIHVYASRGEQGLPSSLKGVSGGPLFSLDQRLLGVNRAQTERAKDGELRVTSRGGWIDLIHSPHLSGAPSDVTIEHCLLAIVVRPANVPIHVEARFFTSAADPNSPMGGMGHIETIVFHKGDATKEHKVSVDRIFYFPSDHDHDARVAAFQDETRLLFEFLGIVKLSPL